MKARKVRIRRPAEVNVESRVAPWSWLDAISGTLDDDFVRAVEEQPQTTERPDLATLFGS